MLTKNDNDQRRSIPNGGNPRQPQGVLVVDVKNRFLSRPFGHSRRLGPPAVFFAVLFGALSLAWAKWEKEQIALETQLTQRIESILSKTLNPKSYLITVKVEMEDSAGGVERRVNSRGGGNPFLEKNRFLLPGVPEKKQFSTTPQVTEENTGVNQPVEALVKKISITILVAPDVTKEQIRSLRDFLSSAIPFNPLRGDELDISTSPLLQSTTPSVKSGAEAAIPFPTPSANRSFDTRNLPLIVLLSIVALGLIGLAIFLFGTVRAFFNRLLAVLPRVGEQAIYAANNNPAAAPAAAATPTPQMPYPSYGSNGDNGPKLNMPFQFIREEQLSKLALLFRELSSSEAALILAYLPPVWASRMLASFDAATQAAITRELTKSREVPAEVVNQVEAQIREKLPYMVGGMEWVQSVFPLTPPQTQKVLLNTLSQESPEMARSLRQKTFFFEDLAALSPAALRVLVQEMGYPQTALALKDEKKDVVAAVLGRLPPGLRNIIQQEIDLSGTDKAAIAEVKNRLVTVARRLLAEGRMTLGGVH